MNDVRVCNDKLNHSSNFIHSQTSYSKGNVFDRLLQDSALRKKNSEILVYTQKIKPKPKPQVLDHKIEEILMQKHQAAQARLAALKIKYQAEEVKDLRPIPQINNISRKIVELSTKLANGQEEGVHDEKDYATRVQEILSNTRYSKMQLKQKPEEYEQNAFDEISNISKPKQTEISLKELEKSVNSKDTTPRLNVPTQVFRFPSDTTQFNSPKSNVKLQSSQGISSSLRETTVPTSRRANGNQFDSQKHNHEPHEVHGMSIDELREAVRSRPKVFEHEEPPDLLEMDVVERGKFWLKYKHEKIELERKRLEKREVEGCTFSPQISPRVNTNYSLSSINGINRSMSVGQLNLSYTQIYLNKKHYRSSSNRLRSPKAFEKINKAVKKIPPKIKIKYSSQSPPPVLRSLSPTVKNISYQSGFNVNDLISRAQPMIDYRALGVI